MPNLVVYVPAQVARTLEAKGVSKDIQRRACAEVLDGLANGGLGEGVSRAAVPVSDAVPPQAAAAPSPSPSEGEVTRTMSGRSTSPRCEREFGHGGAHQATIDDTEIDPDWKYVVSWWPTEEATPNVEGAVT